MLLNGETFFTSIGCMDGRVQEPVKRFGQKNFGAVYPDTITEAGLVSLLSRKRIDEGFMSSLRKKILISVDKHHSKGIVVHGHQDCAGNPVSDKKHKDNVKTSVETVKSLINFSVPVLGAFVKRRENEWIVEEI